MAKHIAIAASLLILVGCHQSASTHMDPHIQSTHVVITAPVDKVFESAIDVLRGYGFKIAEANVATGRIVTSAEVGKHWFEFWRKDSVTLHDTWKSTIKPLRKRIEIKVSSTDDEQNTTMEVLANVEQFSTPERQITNSAALVMFLAPDLPNVRTGQRITPEQTRWIPVGRDARLEYQVASNIRSAIGRTVANER